MKIVKKDFAKKVQSKLIERDIIPDCPIEGAESIIDVVFEMLKESLQQPQVDLFNGWGIRIKKSILPPRKLVNLRNKSELISVPEKARYYLKIVDAK